MREALEVVRSNADAPEDETPVSDDEDYMEPYREPTGPRANPVPIQTEIRPATRYTAVLADGTRVAYDTCSECRSYSTYCACEGGPKPGKYLGEVDHIESMLVEDLTPEPV